METPDSGRPAAVPRLPPLPTVPAQRGPLDAPGEEITIPVPVLAAPAIFAVTLPPVPDARPSAFPTTPPPVPPRWTPPPPWIARQPGPPRWTPAYPPSGPPWPPPSGPPYLMPGYPPSTPRKHGMVLLVGIGFVVLVLVACAGALAFGLPALVRASRSTAQPRVSADATPTVTGSATLGPVGVSLASVLQAQSVALLAGNEAAWLAPVDPKSTSAVAAYKRLYHNLRGMSVRTWQQTIDDDSTVTGTRKTYEIDVVYCLAATTCTDTRATLHVIAQRKSGRIRFEELVPPKPNRYTNEPLPWQVSTLTAVVGKRVVVAASSALSWRLSTALPIAERAAEAADAYAKWGEPSQYVVYLADRSEGKTWFNGDLVNVDGVSYTMRPHDIQIVIMLPDAADTRYAGPGGLNAVIQHEMGHVVTLFGIPSGVGHDSFVEGVAEYISYTGHPGWDRYRVSDVRSYLRGDKWSEKVYLTGQITSKSVLAASAAYGIGYLALRHLAEQYGRDRMLNFFADIERGGMSLDTASRKEFSKPWTSVNTDCVDYIRGAVS